MQVSYRWLGERVDLSAVKSPSQVADLLTARGIEVEECKRQDQGFDHVVTVKILERNPHPQADRLSLCKVSLGSGEPLEIVCGAQNMKAGDTVVLAQIGALLPNGLKIEKSKIRGVVSNGMLCSEEELGLKEKAEGILILPASTPLGRPIAEVLGRDDTIFALKVTANRGDCLSHEGVAREVAAALGQEMKPLVVKPLAERGLPKAEVAIQLEAGEKAPQFLGAVIDGVKVGPSPAWVVKRLEAIGSRSINNVVDATNLVMFELGHPVHAYDAQKVGGKKMGVRLSKPGEKFPLLDDSSVTCDGSELVIVNGDGPVGLAGVMGGGNSEVQDSTTRLFLECAEFDPVLVRRAAKRHAKRTEACVRFEKGIDPKGLDRVISRLADLIIELAGGKVISFSAERTPARASWKASEISVEKGYFARFLGAVVEDSEAFAILKRLGCQVKEGATVTVTAPSWRQDIRIPEDLADEVARTIGFDRIPSTPPALTGLPSAVHSEKGWNDYGVLMRAKEALRSCGLQEALNYSATSKKWLEQFGLEGKAVIQNPITEDMGVMTPALLPLLVRSALDQERHHFGSEPLPIRLFEIRPTFHAPDGVSARSQTDTGVEEHWRIAFAMSGPRAANGLSKDLEAIDFADVKGVFERLIDDLGTKGVRMVPVGSAPAGKGPSSAGSQALVGLRGLFHPGQTVEVLAGPQSVGFFGRIHPRLQKELKLRSPLWVCELDAAALWKMSRGAFLARSFKSWPQFPPMERDFALLVKAEVPVDQLVQIAVKAGKPIAKSARVFDIYRGAQVAEGMTSVAVRVIFYEDQRSLEEPETEAVSAKILEAWKKELGAELRG